MKKSELVLGNVVKAYKGETKYEITSITEELVILNGEKEVKISTLLKNYKLVKEAEAKVEVEEGPKSEEVEALVAEIEERKNEKENEREFLDEVDRILGERAGCVEEVDTDPVVESEPEVESTENVEEIEENVEVEPVLLNKNCFGNEIIDESADNENIQKHNAIKREIIIDSKEIYGIPVKTINQTTIWKILKAICEKQDAEGTQVANQLFIKYPEIFNNSKRCLASKKKIAYIDSILEEA